MFQRFAQTAARVLWEACDMPVRYGCSVVIVLRESGGMLSFVRKAKQMRLYKNHDDVVFLTNKDLKPFGVMLLVPG